ncbi:MAG: hypothetical protein RR873_07395 [Christensenella sp.]
MDKGFKSIRHKMCGIWNDFIDFSQSPDPIAVEKAMRCELYGGCEGFVLTFFGGIDTIYIDIAVKLKKQQENLMLLGLFPYSNILYHLSDSSAEHRQSLYFEMDRCIDATCEQRYDSFDVCADMFTDSCNTMIVLLNDHVSAKTNQMLKTAFDEKCNIRYIKPPTLPTKP